MWSGTVTYILQTQAWQWVMFLKANGRSCCCPSATAMKQEKRMPSEGRRAEEDREREKKTLHPVSCCVRDIPEVLGVIFEKAQKQFSQRRMVSAVVGGDVFGCFWNHVNVQHGTETVLKSRHVFYETNIQRVLQTTCSLRGARRSKVQGKQTYWEVPLKRWEDWVFQSCQKETHQTSQIHTWGLEEMMLCTDSGGSAAPSAPARSCLKFLYWHHWSGCDAPISWRRGSWVVPWHQLKQTDFLR